MKKMLAGRKDLPSWISTSRVGTTTIQGGAERKQLNGNNVEVFISCKAHDCENTSFGVLFTADGARAVGVLRIGKQVTLLGSPSVAELRLLMDDLQ